MVFYCDGLVETDVGTADVADICKWFDGEWSKTIVLEVKKTAETAKAANTVKHLELRPALVPLVRRVLQKVAERRLLPTFQALEKRLPLPKTLDADYQFRAAEMRAILDPSLPIEFDGSNNWWSGLSMLHYNSFREYKKEVDGECLYYPGMITGYFGPNRVFDTWMPDILKWIEKYDAYFCRLLAHLYT